MLNAVTPTASIMDSASLKFSLTIPGLTKPITAYKIVTIAVSLK